jgi:hypothetical protein
VGIGGIFTQDRSLDEVKRHGEFELPVLDIRRAVPSCKKIEFRGRILQLILIAAGVMFMLQRKRYGAGMLLVGARCSA